MIERWLQYAIRTQISELTADPIQIDQVFQKLGLDDAEIAGVKTKYLADEPAVIFEYPRDNDSFPLFAVSLRSENEDTKYLADLSKQLDAVDVAAQYEDLGEDLVGTEELGATFQHEFNIMVVTKHRDVTVYYYHLLRYFLMKARPFLASCGLWSMEYGGRTLAPDERYLPAHLYARTLSFRCKHEFTVVGEPPPRATTIEGAHVIGGGTDPTGVTPGITVTD